MNNKIYFLLFLIIAVCLYWIFNPTYPKKVEKIVEEIEVDSTLTVTFSAVGDIMCHSTQYNYAWVKKDSFDFKPVFRYIKDYLKEKDILFGNLETVLAGKTKKYSGYPFFNSPNQLAEALKYTGFDFLITANNHANDQGFDGVVRTINELKKVNIVSVGTKNIKDSAKTYNLFVRKGLRFGVLAYTYGTNYNENALTPKKYINHIDTLKIKHDIKELRDKHADIVIIYFHFGEQYQKQITEFQKKVVRSTINSGADIILASHPHIIQQFERFKTNGAKVDTGFVTYSLGNFVSNQRWRYSDGGLIFNFNVTKNIFTDSVYISGVSFLPIWVFKGKTVNGKEYLVLPSNYSEPDSLYKFLTPSDVDSIKRSYFDTVELFTAKTNYPKIEKFELKK